MHTLIRLETGGFFFVAVSRSAPLRSLRHPEPSGIGPQSVPSATACAPGAGGLCAFADQEREAGRRAPPCAGLVTAEQASAATEPDRATSRFHASHSFGSRARRGRRPARSVRCRAATLRGAVATSRSAGERHEGLVEVRAEKLLERRGCLAVHVEHLLVARGRPVRRRGRGRVSPAAA